MTPWLVQAVPVEFGLESCFRMSEVKRWHVINTTREQTLADHSFQVAMITRTIIASLDPHWTINDAYCAVIMAMTHDSHEVLLGDTPTCAKPFNETHGLNRIDAKVQLYRDNLNSLSPFKADIAVKVIKLADTMEALVWLSQNRTGTHSNKILEEITARYLLLSQEATSFLPPSVIEQLNAHVAKVRQQTGG